MEVFISFCFRESIDIILCKEERRDSLVVAQMAKKLPAMHETLVQSLHGEYSLENRMATDSSILFWRIPQTKDPARL